MGWNSTTALKGLPVSTYLRLLSTLNDEKIGILRFLRVAFGPKLEIINSLTVRVPTAI